MCSCNCRLISHCTQMYVSLLSMFALGLWENASRVLYMFHNCLHIMFEHHNGAAGYLEVHLEVQRLHNLNG